MTSRLVFQSETDLLTDSPNVTKIEVAIHLARGADAYEGQVGLVDSLDRVLYRAEPICIDGASDDLLNIRLNDRRLTGIDEVDFRSDRIHSDHLVSFLCETCRRH